jgi:hypothetical protein
VAPAGHPAAPRLSGHVRTYGYVRLQRPTLTGGDLNTQLQKYGYIDLLILILIEVVLGCPNTQKTA